MRIFQADSTSSHGSTRHVGADSLKKPHDIVTLSFSEIFFQVEGQTKYFGENL